MLAVMLRSHISQFNKWTQECITESYNHTVSAHVTWNLLYMLDILDFGHSARKLRRIDQHKLNEQADASGRRLASWSLRLS